MICSGQRELSPDHSFHSSGDAQHPVFSELPLGWMGTVSLEEARGTQVWQVAGGSP